jgi:hypothetical protein
MAALGAGSGRFFGKGVHSNEYSRDSSSRGSTDHRICCRQGGVSRTEQLPLGAARGFATAPAQIH